VVNETKIADDLDGILAVSELAPGSAKVCTSGSTTQTEVYPGNALRKSGAIILSLPLSNRSMLFADPYGHALTGQELK